MDAAMLSILRFTEENKCLKLGVTGKELLEIFRGFEIKDD